jgi:heme oxygenase (biliverdin-producing, ferredoxin)
MRAIIPAQPMRHDRAMDVPLREGLAQRLRLETRALHGQAEASALMRALIAGNIERGPYVALLHNLRALYAALETALAQHRADPRLRFATAPALLRTARIEQDLEALAPPDAPPNPLAEATQAYVQHLHTLAAREPLRLVAHAYVRYLGDLYGGQQLARGLRERLGLQGDAGTRFYDFGSPAQAQALRLGLRASLDAVQPSPAESDAIVDEACAAFRRHIALFEQLSLSR